MLKLFREHLLRSPVIKWLDVHCFVYEPYRRYRRTHFACVAIEDRGSSDSSDYDRAYDLKRVTVSRRTRQQRSCAFARHRYGSLRKPIVSISAVVHIEGSTAMAFRGWTDCTMFQSIFPSQPLSFIGEICGEQIIWNNDRWSGCDIFKISWVQKTFCAGDWTEVKEIALFFWWITMEFCCRVLSSPLKLMLNRRWGNFNRNVTLILKDVNWRNILKIPFAKVQRKIKLFRIFHCLYNNTPATSTLIELQLYSPVNYNRQLYTYNTSGSPGAETFNYKA